MGGMLGVWNRDGRPVDPALLARLHATLAHRREVACLTIPSRDAAPAFAAAFDGRLDNRDELIGALGIVPGVDAAAADSTLVLAAYRAWGEDFAARLTGDFAVAIADPVNQVLLLARDALGVRPLYYAAAPGVVIAASEIKAIVAHPDIDCRPDDDVLADYLFNLLAGEDTRGVTFFAGVSSVLPSHIVRITTDAVTSRRYWDFDPARQVAVRRIEEAADGLREHFVRAVSRRLRTPSPVAISVSGGVDSSAIFCAAETVRRTSGGPPIVGCSYTVADGLPADEKRYLADIERMYGVAIHRWQDLPGGLLDGSREGIWHLEVPALDTRWTGTLEYYRRMRALGVRTIVTGHWGDQFMVEDGFLVDLIRAGRWATAWRDIREYRRWKHDGAGDVARTLPRALARELLPRRVLHTWRRWSARRRSGADLEAWYASAFVARRLRARRAMTRGSEAGSAHARALYQHARSRYHVLGMEWHNKLAAMHGLEASFPFLDRDLIAFLMALPGDIVTWRGTPKGLLRLALRGMVPDAILDRRTKADFSADVNTETARDYGKLVAQVRSGRAVALGYLDQRAIRADAAPAADADTCTLSWALTDALSLELWLQAFFGDRTEASEHA